MVVYLDVRRDRGWCINILFFHGVEFDCESRQHRSQTGDMAKYPDQLVLHPVKQLVITNADDKYRLHLEKAQKKQS